MSEPVVLEPLPDAPASIDWVAVGLTGLALGGAVTLFWAMLKGAGRAPR